MIKIKNFECPKSIRNYEKNNAWNIRLLVGGLLGQTNKRPIVICIRLTKFISVAALDLGYHKYLLINIMTY